MTRALMGVEKSTTDAERVLKSAGGYWEMADKSAKETSSNGTGAAAIAKTVKQLNSTNGYGSYVCSLWMQPH